MKSIAPSLLGQEPVLLGVEGLPLERHWYLVRLAEKLLTPAAGAFLDLLISRPSKRDNLHYRV